MVNGDIWPNLRITNGLSRDMAHGYLNAINAGGALVMDDPQMAIELASLCKTVIYRQSGDDAKDDPYTLGPQEFVNRRIHPGFDAYKDFIIIHGTNEIDPSPRLDQFNLSVSNYCHYRGYRACLYNHSSNKTMAQWDEHRNTIPKLIARGDLIGFHLYDDFNHRDGDHGWQHLKDALGGNWAATEIAYIRDLKDANHGQRNAPGLTVEKHMELWNLHAAILLEQGIILCPYSLDNWPPGKEGEESGFGYYSNDAKDPLRNKFKSLNGIYTFKGFKMALINKPTTMPTKIVITSLGTLDLKNIRTQPGATDAVSDVGDLKVGDVVNAYLSSPSGGWIYIEHPKPTEGWVLWSGVLYQEPDAAGATLYTITNANLDALKMASSSLQHIIEQAQTAKDQIDSVIKGAKPALSGGGF